MAEEDGFLDIGIDNPSEEMAICDDGPEYYENSNEWEGTNEDLGENRYWLGRCTDLDDVEESLAVTIVHGSRRGEDRGGGRKTSTWGGWGGSWSEREATQRGSRRQSQSRR